MSRRSWKIAIVGLIAAIMSIGAVGCRGHHGRHSPEKMYKFMTWGLEDALDDLDADEAQRKAIHGVKDWLFERVQAVRADRKEIRSTVLAEWNKETPDAALIHRLVDAKADELRALAHEAVDEMVGVHGVLNEKQRADIAKRIEAHHGGH